MTDGPLDRVDALLAETRDIKARLDANLQLLATAINTLSDRITALDNRLRAQEGSVTDHNAELLGKAIRHISHG